MVRVVLEVEVHVAQLAPGVGRGVRFRVLNGPRAVFESWASAARGEEDFSAANLFLDITSTPVDIDVSARDHLWSNIEEWLSSELYDLARPSPSEETPPEEIRRDLDNLISVRERHLSQSSFSEQIREIDYGIRSFEDYEPDDYELDYTHYSAYEDDPPYRSFTWGGSGVGDMPSHRPAPDDEVTSLLDELS